MPNYYNSVTLSIASGSQATDACKIQGIDGVSIEIPTFSAGLNTGVASVYLSGAETSTGTFRKIHAMGVYSGVSGLALWEVPEGNGNYTVQCGEVAKQLPAFIKVNVDGTNATATAAGYSPVVHLYK